MAVADFDDGITTDLPADPRLPMTGEEEVNRNRLQPLGT